MKRLKINEKEAEDGPFSKKENTCPIVKIYVLQLLEKSDLDQSVNF